MELKAPLAPSKKAASEPTPLKLFYLEPYFQHENRLIALRIGLLRPQGAANQVVSVVRPKCKPMQMREAAPKPSKQLLC